MKDNKKPNSKGNVNGVLPQAWDNLQLKFNRINEAGIYKL